MEISLVKLFSRDGASEAYKLPLELSEMEIGGGHISAAGKSACGTYSDT